MNLQLIISNQTNPYWNVAVENYMLNLPLEHTVTMYLWQNHRTVVIGQNQNPYTECNVDLLTSEGGYVMRRRTGGGAVYHDSGNINFSFIASHDLYDQARQFAVLQQAVAYYGLHTELSGRNDVLCMGRKFSGNAFSKGKYQNLHHGTVLIKSNMDDLQRYLKVKPSKLQKHGVQSVSSRVVNLSELADVTAQNIVPRLIQAFKAVYGENVQELSFSHITSLPEVQALYEQFVSPEWLWGKWKNFKAQKSARFSWGEVELCVNVSESDGIIRSVEIASDSLHPEVIDYAGKMLTGASIYVAPHIEDNSENAAMLRDICTLLY